MEIHSIYFRSSCFSISLFIFRITVILVRNHLFLKRMVILQRKPITIGICYVLDSFSERLLHLHSALIRPRYDWGWKTPFYLTCVCNNNELKAPKMNHSYFVCEAADDKVIASTWCFRIARDNDLHMSIRIRSRAIRSISLASMLPSSPSREVISCSAKPCFSYQAFFRLHLIPKHIHRPPSNLTDDAANSPWYEFS